MVQNLSPRDFDKETRQPQLTLVASNPAESADASPIDPPFEPGPDSVGGTLRRARIARGGKSLEDIANELRIRPHLLAALENDDFDQLPGLIYASGFLRTYATWLGLDPAPLVERLKGSGSAPVQDMPLVFPEPINDPRIPRRPLVALAVILCLAVYGVWYSFSGSGDRLDKVPAPSRDFTDLSAEAPATPAPPAAVSAEPSAVEAPAAPLPGEPEAATEPAPSPPAATQAAATQAAPVQAAPTPAPAPAVTAAPGQILLRATADSWIRVTDAHSKIISERILRAGDSYAVPADAGYVLLAGNAGGLVIETAGKHYGPLGAAGDVRRNFALSAASVATLPAR